MKNRYGFLNNKFVLVKYIVVQNNVENNILTDERLVEITSFYDESKIEYSVENVDNSSIEWLLNYDIVPTDVANAIEIGEEAYKQLINSTDYSAKIAELELFNSELLLQNANLTIANTQNESDIAMLAFQMAMSQI